jgi:hypothetical protein
MGPEVPELVLAATSEDPSISETGYSGANFDRAATFTEANEKGCISRIGVELTSIVEHAVLEGPAVDVPRPVGKRAVDESGPEEEEDATRPDATALSNS